MNVIIETDPNKGSDLAAEMVAARVRADPACVLGLATGGTPRGMYQRLIEMHRLEGLDFSQVTTFNPDEFVGVPADHPATWHSYMETELFGKVNLSASRCQIPDGNAADLDAMIARYNRALEMSGGVDVQIIGIGGDGHIAANDPGSSLASRMRRIVITLNKRGYLADVFGGADKMPRFAVTLGLADFLDSKHAVVLAFGAGKAKVVAQMVEGPVTASLPASVLQMHPNVDVIIDEAAAAELSNADYYREVRRRERG
jgi:glucosamine-6-phosphate deaminase